jgi:hypothetical protein
VPFSSLRFVFETFQSIWEHIKERKERKKKERKKERKEIKVVRQGDMHL